MKFYKVLVAMLILTVVSIADDISLQQCFDIARKNHPVLKPNASFEKKKELELNNLKTKWLPSSKLNLLAKYQSNVTKLGISLPSAVIGTSSMPTPDKDSYSSEIELSQLLFDGGFTSVQKKLIIQENKISKQSQEVVFMEVKSFINQVFHNHIYLTKQKEILLAWEEDLKESKEFLTNLVNQGIKEKIDVVEIEIKLEELHQNLHENQIHADNNFNILKELVGEDIEGIPVLPKNNNVAHDKKFTNAQSKQFEYQLDLLDIAGTLPWKNRMPKVFSFGRFGYGKPGINMLNDDFDSYYIFGVKMEWNILDWKYNKRESEKKRMDYNIMKYAEENYNQKTRIELQKYLAKIEDFNQKIEKDSKIFEMHNEIKNLASVKFKNGVMTTTDYLKYDNNTVRANLTMELHKVLLNKEITNYLILKGEL